MATPYAVRIAWFVLVCCLVVTPVVGGHVEAATDRLDHVPEARTCQDGAVGLVSSEPGGTLHLPFTTGAAVAEERTAQPAWPVIGYAVGPGPAWSGRLDLYLYLIHHVLLL